MATYTGTMYVGGEEYSSTAGGYQIAGGDACTAQASCTLPSTYESYESCSISCTLYSATAPSSWKSDWGCFLGVYKNGYLYGGDTQWIDRNYFGDGNGASSRTFSVNLSGGYFEPDDTVEIRFIGSDGGYVDSSNRCVYLTGASFYSADATMKSVTLTYSANGGSYAPTAVTRVVGSSGSATFPITSIQAMYTGYTFQGWATSPNGGVAYEAGDSITISRDTTLYAVWAKNYTLSFSANGGSGAPSSKTAEADSSGSATITIPSTEPTRSNYVFLGWAKSSSATSAAYEPGDYIEISADTMLYAVWRAVTYTLAYDDNGADSGAAPTDSTEYTSGSAATVAGNTGSMALEGHVFAGWNTAADGTGTTYAPGDSLTITKSTTLYAVWVLDEQVYIYTGTAWQKGEPEIFNGTAWQSGELALYANNNWNS